jgi:hypothetical protein
MMGTVIISNSRLLFISAERLISERLEEQAKDIYLTLLDYKEFASLAHYRLGEIENRNHNIEKSYYHHKKALELDKKLSLRVTNNDSPNHSYEYSNIEELQT